VHRCVYTGDHIRSDGLSRRLGRAVPLLSSFQGIQEVRLAAGYLNKTGLLSIRKKSKSVSGEHP
jgi:hypothetical protein